MSVYERRRKRERDRREGRRERRRVGRRRGMKGQVRLSFHGYYNIQTQFTYASGKPRQTD